MRPSRFWSAVVLFLCFAATLIAQNPSVSTPHALSVLHSSFQALTGNATVNDATLTGSAEWIAGSDDETGTVVLKTTSSANRLDLSLSAGTRSEIRSSTDNGPVGSWIGPDGVSHPVANHNLMTDAGWFPAFTLANLISSSNTILLTSGRRPGTEPPSYMSARPSRSRTSLVKLRL